jgi:hypothetical protein
MDKIKEGHTETIPGCNLGRIIGEALSLSEEEIEAYEQAAKAADEKRFREREETAGKPIKKDKNSDSEKLHKTNRKGA